MQEFEKKKENLDHFAGVCLLAALLLATQRWPSSGIFAIGFCRLRQPPNRLKGYFANRVLFKFLLLLLLFWSFVLHCTLIHSSCVQNMWLAQISSFFFFFFIYYLAPSNLVFQKKRKIRKRENKNLYLRGHCSESNWQRSLFCIFSCPCVCCPRGHGRWEEPFMTCRSSQTKEDEGERERASRVNKGNKQSDGHLPQQRTESAPVCTWQEEKKKKWKYPCSRPR